MVSPKKLLDGPFFIGNRENYWEGSSLVLGVLILPKKTNHLERLLNHESWSWSCRYESLVVYKQANCVEIGRREVCLREVKVGFDGSTVLGQKNYLSNIRNKTSL